MAVVLRPPNAIHLCRLLGQGVDLPVFGIDLPLQGRMLMLRAEQGELFMQR